jgi:hypothetical protein
MEKVSELMGPANLKVLIKGLRKNLKPSPKRAAAAQRSEQR